MGSEIQTLGAQWQANGKGPAQEALKKIASQVPSEFAPPWWLKGMLNINPSMQACICAGAEHAGGGAAQEDVHQAGVEAELAGADEMHAERDSCTSSG